MKQIITPDLNTVGLVGWCLAFVEKAYNDTNYSYATAHNGWEACHIIHQDRNLPSDVMVPIWFDYYEQGINYGHVAINVPGRGILSSPWKADNTQQWEPDIDTISRVYNCTYVGWSEDLMGVKVVIGDEPMFNEGDRKNQNDAFFGEDKGYFKEFVDKMTYKEATEKILGSAQYLGETRLNDGDLTNIFNKTGWPAEPAIKGWLWKRFWEDYASNKVGSGVDYEPVNETLYKKKA